MFRYFWTTTLTFDPLLLLTSVHPAELDHGAPWHFTLACQNNLKLPSLGIWPSSKGQFMGCLWPVLAPDGGIDSQPVW